MRSVAATGPPCSTRSDTVSAAPLAAVAITSASPTARPVAIPPASIVATSGALVVHVIVAPVTVLSASSNAAAVKVWVAPTSMVAVSGEITTRAMVAGGASSSLHAPKVLAFGPSQIPAPVRLSDCPTGSVPASRTPMLTDVIPVAGPLSAVIAPSYERNSTTAPLGLTSAIPSGSPFWMPLLGYASTTTPRAPQMVGTMPLSVRVGS